jgi:uncharacterized membrane protein
MTKSEFLLSLENELKNIPDYEKALDFYSEMIDDRIEDGMSEEDAINSLESIDSIRDRMINEIPLPTLIKEKASKPLSALNVVLLVLGFPFWFPLLFAAVLVVFSLYITAVFLVFSFYIVVFAFAFSGIIGFIAAFFHLASNPAYAVLNMGLSMIMVGLSILLIYPAIRLGQKSIKTTKQIIWKTKSLFVQKGGKS